MISKLTILAEDNIRFYKVHFSHGEPLVVSASDSMIDFNKGIQAHLQENLEVLHLIPTGAIITAVKEVEFIEAGDVFTVVKGMKVREMAA